MDLVIEHLLVQVHRCSSFFPTRFSGLPTSSTAGMMPPYAAQGELRRNTPLPRTRLSKGSKLLYVAYMEPLRGRETLARKGVHADERASSQSGEQGHPRVG